MPPSDLRVHWQITATGLCLQTGSDWRGFVPTPQDAYSLQPALPLGTPLTVDASQLRHWDDNSSAGLWTLIQPLAARAVEVQLGDLPEALAAPLRLALQALPPPSAATVASVQPPAAAPLWPWFHWQDAVGAAFRWSDLRTTLTFLGELLLALTRLWQVPRVFRWRDLLQHMDHMGPGSLPIVALTTFLVGLMLAYMGGAQLDRIGAPGLIADVVTVGIVRELAALMTGVILAGRIGAAIAAELGTMVVKDEIDALRALGIDPLLNLVGPRLLAMLLTAPFLLCFAMVVGVLAGLPAAMLAYGVPATEYLHKALKALNWTHLWIGLFKGTLYTMLVVVAGCREGLYAGHDAQAIGVATTRAVVKALVWIVVAACGTTVVLQSLGF